MACVHPTKVVGQLSLPATVPGDLISDLLRNGLIGEPLFEANFLNGSSTWNLPRWLFTKLFDLGGDFLQSSAADGVSLLVFDGVKMGATIYLNGKRLGTATDQFLRYTFPVPNSALAPKANNLTLVFDVGIECDGRWMACTGGWDWAPYSYTSQEGGFTFTKGIWKSVYLVAVANATITAMTAQTFYKGPYPVAPLNDTTHSGFRVEVATHLWASVPTSGLLTVAGEWGEVAQVEARLAAGENVVRSVLQADASMGVTLWWPNGLSANGVRTYANGARTYANGARTYLGAQGEDAHGHAHGHAHGRQHGQRPLYTVSVAFTSSSPAGGQTTSPPPPVMASRKVGFRVVALVTGDDTNASYVQWAEGRQGTDHLGMLFRVNGAAIFTRGANMIPMDELEGRLDAEAHRTIVRSAADAHFNMLRVWGGGMFLPDAFYDSCDEHGVLVYHDMQYAQHAHKPKATREQDAELRYQIRRLSSHPSIAVWDGCNECQVLLNTSTGVYASFVMTVVAQEDTSRAIWPSCPARGWASGVDKLTSRPIAGATLVPHPLNERTIEAHGPYQHGNGFSSTNGHSKLLPPTCKSSIPIEITPTSETGVTKPNIFASEFGSVGMSSFESMSPTLLPQHWGLHAALPPDNCTTSWDRECHGSNPMSLRNYPCDNLISYYFDYAKLEVDKVGEHVFKKQLWQCLLSQALELKGDIETRRAQNTFGILVWQLNEIWPTGGWGTVEYGNPNMAGQVIGGRWKPAHYWYRKSIFADVMATCGAKGVCYVKNDSPETFAGIVTVTSYRFATGTPTVLYTEPVALAAGPGVMSWFTITMPSNLSEEILTAVVSTATDDLVISDNLIPLTAPVHMAISKAEISLTVADQAATDGSVAITVTTDKVAVYVTLTTLANGRFSDNAFLLLPAAPLTLQFHPFGALDLARLKASLRVEDLSAYI